MGRLALIVLLVSPFLLGLNLPWAWTALGLALLPAAARGLPVPAGLRPLLMVAAAFALGLPLLQLAGGTCAAIPSATPCAAWPEMSLLSLLMAAVLLLWFLLLAGPRRPRTDDLLKALAIAGGLQAAYGLAMHFLGQPPLFMEHVFRHTDVPTGGFPNRNHYAAFLYICTFAAIALVLRLPGDTGTGRAGRWRLLLDQRVYWRLLVVLMVLALIATRSRAGNAGLVIGLLAGAAWLFLVERRRQQGSSNKKPLRFGFVAVVLASVLLLDTILIGSFVGLEKVQQRIAETTLESDQRFDVNATLLEHPELLTTVAGHGAASFLPAFEPVKPAGAWALYNMAHNDYLQVLVERGWLGTLLFALAFVLLCARALRRQAGGRGAEVRFAFVAATAALLAQASVEYVTQVPALWLAWLTLAALAAAEPAQTPARRRSGGRA